MNSWRLSIDEAKSYWFQNDLVVYAFGGQNADPVIALPKVEVERGLRYLRKLKDCKTYGEAQDLYIEFTNDPDAPKLIPRIQDLRNHADVVYQLWEGTENSAQGVEPTLEQVLAEIRGVEFQWSEAQPYLDENEIFVACRDFEIWTDFWIPREIAEEIGTPDRGYGVDYNPAELLFKNMDLFVKEFSTFGIEVLVDHPALGELALSGYGWVKD